MFEVAPEEIGEYRRPTSLKGKRANRLYERGRPTFPASASTPFPLVRLMAREGLPARPCSSCSRMWNRISHLIPRSPWVSCGVDALGGKTFYKYLYGPCLKEPPEAPEENERLVRAASAPPAPPRIPVSSAGQSITFELFMASLWGRLPPSTSVFMAQCIKVALDCFFFE